MLGPSIRAGSEGWYRVIGPGQNVGMKTRPDDQPKFNGTSVVESLYH